MGHAIPSIPPISSQAPSLRGVPGLERQSKPHARRCVAANESGTFLSLRPSAMQLPAADTGVSHGLAADLSSFPAQTRQRGGRKQLGAIVLGAACLTAYFAAARSSESLGMQGVVPGILLLDSGTTSDRVLSRSGTRIGPSIASSFAGTFDRASLTPVMPLVRSGSLLSDDMFPREPWPADSIDTARARELGIGTRAVAGDLLRGKVQPKWMMAAGGTDETPGTLLWPVPNGWYVRGFGSGTGGYHLAVDIMAKHGSNVLAAAEGIVAYADDGVRGFGNIILIVHRGGWVTSYAHNRRNLVAPGERVARGQRIAELGSTGISRGPHVHFELMHDGKNCDPAPLFRPAIKHHYGARSLTTQALWSKPSDRPREISCHRRIRHPHSRYKRRRHHS